MKILLLVALALHVETVTKPKPWAPAVKSARTVWLAPGASVTEDGSTPSHVILMLPVHDRLVVLVLPARFLTLNLAVWPPVCAGTGLSALRKVTEKLHGTSTWNAGDCSIEDAELLGEVVLSPHASRSKLATVKPIAVRIDFS
jgi:hypothetical protein